MAIAENNNVTPTPAFTTAIERERQIAELRRLWFAGIASGPGRFETIDALIEDAERRLPSPRQS